MITCSSTVFPVLFFLTLNVECHNTNILSKCVSKGEKQKHVAAPVHTDSCWKRGLTLLPFRRTAAPCWSSWGGSWHRRRGSCRWWRQEQRSSAHSDSRITCCKARCINTSYFHSINMENVGWPFLIWVRLVFFLSAAEKCRRSQSEEEVGGGCRCCCRWEVPADW